MSVASRVSFAAFLTLCACSSTAKPGTGSERGGGDAGDDAQDPDGGSEGELDASDESEESGRDSGLNLDCGDDLLSASEECDDGNREPLDGCGASCRIEPGYACPVVGARCRAAACGDGIVAGDEECEDGNADPGDGCSERCRLEPGFACESVGETCQPTLCGDGETEGSEQCDDGADDQPFDGCYQCVREPSCDESGCAPVCGDGIKFPGEACDDENLRSADGCSSECKLEEGFSCTAQVEEPPAFVDLPIILRDFRGHDLPAIAAEGIAEGHIDFQNKNVAETGIVTDTLSADKKPVYAKADNSSASTHTAEMFDKWYRDDPMYNRTVVSTVRLERNDGGDYVFFDADYFPLDGIGFVGEGHESARNDGHNFHFTSELRTQFEYKGGEFLRFEGDDDVWVFVNGRLAVDLGGVHGAQDGSVTLDPSGSDARFAITAGNIYEIVVFQAERHTSKSQYRLTLRDFVRERTRCESICGDGQLTPDEACDDGDNLGGYGKCAEGCVFGPRCGDGVVQEAEGEECDDQNRSDLDECTNACRRTIVL
jgi:fibro-slime domain-containing protein